MGMTVLLTGATGFIGRHVLREALAAGHSVRAVVRNLEQCHFDSHPRLTLIESSLGSVASAHIIGCDVLIHLAAHGVIHGMNDWEACFRVNVSESLHLWLAAVEAGIGRFVICGSCFEYGKSGERYEFIPVDAPLEPTGAYHASKAAASMAAIGLAVEKKLSLTILRPFHVFGEGEDPTRFWPALKKAAQDGKDFEMTMGEQVRDFVPVAEVVSTFLEALVSQVTPGSPVIMNVGSGKPESLSDFAQNWWCSWRAQGSLLKGAVAYRSNEVMRYVPEVVNPRPS